MADSIRPIPDVPSSNEFDVARHSGFKGGFISNHRALLSSPFGTWKLLQTAVLMLAILVVWYLLLPLVGWCWGVLMVGAANALNLVAVVNRPEHYTLANLLHFDVPAVYVPAGLPPRWAWEVGVLITAMLMATSFVLPERYLPLAYMLRLASVLQGVAQVYFAFWPNDFPYTSGGYVHTMLTASLVFIGLIPVVLALTFYLFDFTLGQKLALTAIAIGHQVVMVPLQYILQAFVLYHLSLLFMPVLFFVCSLPLNVFALVAFYGWAFSWPSPLRNPRVQGKIRVTTLEPGAPAKRRGGGTGAALGLLLLALGAPGGAAAQTVAPATPAAAPAPIVQAIEVGFGFGRYDNDLGSMNDEAFRYRVSRINDFALSLDGGHEHRFGADTIRGGLWASKTFGGTTVSAGVGSGTSDVLSPRYRVDVGVMQNIGGVLTTVAFTRVQSRTTNSSNGVSIGAVRYFAHWIVSGNARVDIGYPGRTASPFATVGATWYRWKKIYVGGEVNWGSVSYLLLPDRPTAVDYGSKGGTIRVSRWFNDHSGVNVWGNFITTDIYRTGSLFVSFFREF